MSRPAEAAHGAPATGSSTDGGGTPAAPRFGEALRWWAKLGCLSFGGPAGQIALMHDELVHRRRWISEGRFLHALNYCMLLPGPEAQQLATYVGWLLHGARGGLAAGTLFVLPSLVLMIALAWLYLRFGQEPLVTAALDGVKPAVVALVVAAAWRIGGRALRRPWAWAVALGAFAGLWAGLPFPALLIAAAGAGWLAARAGVAEPSAGHAATAMDDAPAAVIDDATPTPAHARFSRAATLRVLGVFALLWTGAIGLVMAWAGPAGTLTALAWFHSKAALLTFGGAYAVLPYVFQAAVREQGWLDAGQMMDGLALGESTPGPLIMIVAWVGFLGGWQQAPAGTSTVAMGVAGACVATFFTFLPSFLFILAGGPLIESTRDRPALHAPLAGITAAVVGVIAKLAAWFGAEVLWPDGRPDIARLAIMVAALVALVRWRRGAVETLALAALAGLALHALR